MLDGRLTEEAWRRAAAGIGLPAAGSQHRRSRDRIDRGARALRRASHRHRRDLLRLGAEPHHGQSDAARPVARGRRPVHDRHRHLFGRAVRLLLRDQPVGRDGRRARARGQRHAGEPIVGRHLERTRRSQRDGMERGDRDPAAHDQLQSERIELGHQLPADDPPQDRRDALEWMGAQPGADVYAGRGPAAGTRGTSPGARPRSASVRRRQLGGCAWSRFTVVGRRRARLAATSPTT